MPPLKLLAAIAQAPLPQDFEDLDDIERIRVLKAHGHVEANVPEWRFGVPLEPATVHTITALGRKALGDA